jgi:hypothetical protein
MPCRGNKSPWLAIYVVGLLYAGSTRTDAYDVGGHHYTISSILAGPPGAIISPLGAQPTMAQPDPYKVLESFCVELPDLVAELDAITQRIHVLKSAADWQWGALGRCGTRVSRHMVASQWYVHGLTGMDPQKVRGVARSIVAKIQADFAQAQDAQSRVNLICEAGFGLHLLGDTFAHSQLKDPKTMYATGTGHWKDMHVPDYMLSRQLLTVPATSLRWSDWIQAASSALGQPDRSAQLAILSRPILSDPKSQNKDYGEAALTGALINSIPQPWEPYEPSLDKWRKNSLTGDISDARCGKIVKSGATGHGIAPIHGVTPDCDAVWEEYLAVAIPAFATAGADPVRNGGYANCDAQGDKLEYGNL